MNKILKDIIVKYKNMTGFCAPYVDGLVVVHIVVPPK